MTSDFILIAARPNRVLPAAAVETAHRHAQDSVCGGTPQRWEFDGGRVALVGWAGRAESPMWAEGAGRVIVYGGSPVATGRWQAPEAIAPYAIRAEAPLDQVPWLATGVVAVAAVDADGSAVVAADPMGLAHLFIGESEDLTAISTRPEAVAKLISPGGDPELDPFGVGWLAYSRYRVGDPTGFAGVRLARPGTVVRVTHDGPTVLDPVARPWYSTEPASTNPAEAISDHLMTSVLQFAERPAETLYLDLTGGKDSRVLLAVALRAHVAESFTIRTAGPPDLPDVQIAAEIATEFGLRHVIDFDPPGHEASYAERAHRFVDATAGLNSLWDLHTPEPRDPKVRLSGFGGEFIGSWVQPDRQPTSTDAATARLVKRFNRLGLVRPEVVARYDEAVAHEVRYGHPSDRLPVDALDSFQIANSQRQRLGLMESVRTDEWAIPLADVAVVGQAFAAGSAARMEQRLHREIIGAVSKKLLRHRLDGAPWYGERPRRRLGRRGNNRAPEASRDPLMARVHEAASADRVDLLYEVASDESNAAWDVIDRGLFVAATARWARLSKIERQELMGAATAAIWLA